MFLWHSRQKYCIKHFATKCDNFWYRKWIEREKIKRKWGNVESKSPFPHSLFIFSHSGCQFTARCALCNPGHIWGAQKLFGLCPFERTTFQKGASFTLTKQLNVVSGCTLHNCKDNKACLCVFPILLTLFKWLHWQSAVSLFISPAYFAFWEKKKK